MSGSIRFISAGAGSGKTYRLTQLLFKELQAGRVRPAGVLATTFTNRAATELRGRVRSFLVEQGDYDGAVAIGAARIGTVNSVCGGMLQRFAFEAGLPTEQRVLDEARASQLLRETIDTVIAEHSLTELLQVARRLSLDAAPQDPLPPWQKALGRLVDQARANAIDADALRSFGAINAANLLAHFPAPVAGDLDARWGKPSQGRCRKSRWRSSSRDRRTLASTSNSSMPSDVLCRKERSAGRCGTSSPRRHRPRFGLWPNQ